MSRALSFILSLTYIIRNDKQDYMATDINKLLDQAKERQKMYDQNEDLYEGEAYEVFGRAQYNYFKTFNPKNPKLSYVNFNVFAIISKVFSDMIWNEAPKITFKNEANQQWFDIWSETVGFNMKMYEATTFASVLGESILKLNVREVIPKTGQMNVVIDQIDPNIWYPIYDESNVSKPPQYHCLIFEKKVTEDGSVIAYLVEKYGYGEIVYEAYRYANDQYTQVDISTDWSEDLKGVTGFENIQQTKTFLPLVTQLINMSEPHDFHGQSDYTTDLKSLANELNDTLTSLASIRRKHADPLLIVPESAIKQAMHKIKGNQSTNNEFNAFNTQLDGMSDMSANYALAQEVLSSTKVIGLPADGSQTKPEYVTWDSQLPAVFNEIELLKKMIFQQADISPVIYDPAISTGNMSGIAIKRASITMINKSKKKMIYLRKAMQEIIFTAQQLAIANNLGLQGQAEIPNIEFADGFPNDLQELVTSHQGLLDAGLETPQDAMIEIFGYTQKQADAKTQEIQDNQINPNTPIIQNNQTTS